MCHKMAFTTIALIFCLAAMTNLCVPSSPSRHSFPRKAAKPLERAHPTHQAHDGAHAYNLARRKRTADQLTQQLINDRLYSNVISPFQDATLQYNRILSDLWTLCQSKPVESLNLLEIDNSVQSLSNNFIKNLRKSTKNCKMLQKHVFDLVVQKTETASQINAEIDVQNKRISSASVRVQTSKHDVDIAKRGVRYADNNLDTMHQALREAERAHDKAKNNCYRRRRKRFIWLILALTKPGKKVVCGIIGGLSGKIRAKREEIKAAKNRVWNAQRRLESKRADLKSAQNAIQSLRGSLQRLKHQKAAIEANLKDAKQKNTVIFATYAKMMKTFIFLDGVQANGEAVSEKLAQSFILDIELVVNILKEICTDLQQLGGEGVQVFVPSIPQDKIEQMKRTIEQMILRSKQINSRGKRMNPGTEQMYSGSKQINSTSSAVTQDRPKIAKKLVGSAVNGNGATTVHQLQLLYVSLCLSLVKALVEVLKK